MREIQTCLKEQFKKKNRNKKWKQVCRVTYFKNLQVF